MFASERYVTRGVNEVVAVELQLLLWSILEKRKERGDTLNYLQLFELAVETVDGEPLQKVVNRQEQPFHEEVFYLDVSEPVTGITVWAIDSREYCTMLLPQEY